MKKQRNVIYGTHALMEALDAKVHLDKILVDHHLKSKIGKELKERLKGLGIGISFVPRESLDRIIKGTHQGVIAYLSPIAFHDLQDVISQIYENGDIGRFMVLDHITDVRNFGAIARSAECFGFHAMVISEKGSAAVNEEAVNASAGALMKLPVCKVASIASALLLFKQNGYSVLGISEYGKEGIEGIKSDGPIALVMGNEETGIHPLVRSQCDDIRRIHMTGTIQSLNVSVAAAIAMYELNRA